MSLTRRDDRRTNKFKSWVGGVFNEMIIPPDHLDKPSPAKIDPHFQRDSFSTEDSGIGKAEECSPSPAESLASVLGQSLQQEAFGNSYYNPLESLNTSSQLTSFSVHKLKDEPSSERLVEFIDRADDDYEYEYAPSKNQDIHEEQGQTHLADEEHSGSRSRRSLFSKRSSKVSRSSSIERLKKILNVGKPPPDQETERPSRNSFFRFLIRASQASNISGLEDTAVTATSSNPIRKVPSTSPVTHRNTTLAETTTEQVHVLSQHDEGLGDRVDELSRFIVAIVAQERVLVHQAARKIQSVFRGFQTREMIKTYKSLEWYGTTLFPPSIQQLSLYGRRAPHFQDTLDEELRFIITLQHIVRGFLIRRRYLLVANYERSATLIQAAWRGYCTRFKPPPHCPPLGGVVRSLATHRLAVQKLAAQIAILSKRIQSMASAPQQVSGGHQLIRSRQVSDGPNILPTTERSPPLPPSPSLSRNLSDSRSSRPRPSKQPSRSSIAARSVSFHPGDRSNISQRSSQAIFPFMDTNTEPISRDDSSDYDVSSRTVTRDEYNYLVSEVDSLRAIIDAILLHQPN